MHFSIRNFITMDIFITLSGLLSISDTEFITTMT